MIEAAIAVARENAEIYDINYKALLSGEEKLHYDLVEYELLVKLPVVDVRNVTKEDYKNGVQYKNKVCAGSGRYPRRTGDARSPPTYPAVSCKKSCFLSGNLVVLY